MATATVIQPDIVTFDDEKHHYFLNGERVRLSVTGVLGIAGFSDLSKIPPKILQAKRILGKNVHKATEYLDLGLGLDWDNIPAKYIPYIYAYMQFWEDHKPTTGLVNGVPMIEHRGVGTVGGMRCGYTLDRAWWLWGGPFIVEIKCSYDREPFWAYQTAAYETFAPRMDDQKEPYRRIALQLKPDGRYNFGDEYKNLAHDKAVFRSALHIASVHVAEGRIKE